MSAGPFATVVHALATAEDVEALLKDTLGKRIKALEVALNLMVYETTHLTSVNKGGSHNCRISGEALAAARCALIQGKLK